MCVRVCVCETALLWLAGVCVRERGVCVCWLGGVCVR